MRENIRWQPRLRVSKVVSGSSNSVTAILLVKGGLLQCCHSSCDVKTSVAASFISIKVRHPKI